MNLRVYKRIVDQSKKKKEREREREKRVSNLCDLCNVSLTARDWRGGPRISLLTYPPERLSDAISLLCNGMRPRAVARKKSGWRWECYLRKVLGDGTQERVTESCAVSTASSRIKIRFY